MLLNIPFELEDRHVRDGFQTAREAMFLETRPMSDTELAAFIQDFVQDGIHCIEYQVGFLLGLYAQQ